MPQPPPAPSTCADAGMLAPRLHGRRALRMLVMPAALLLLTACALPRTISVYDPECRVVARQMVLQVHDLQVINGCSAGRNCLEQLAVGLAVLATSTVISGSIVVAGNVIYWLEKRQNCQLQERVPIPPAVATSTATSTSTSEPSSVVR